MNLCGIWEHMNVLAQVLSFFPLALVNLDRYSVQLPWHLLLHKWSLKLCWRTPFSKFVCERHVTCCYIHAIKWRRTVAKGFGEGSDFFGWNQDEIQQLRFCPEPVKWSCHYSSMPMHFRPSVPDLLLVTKQQEPWLYQLYFTGRACISLTVKHDCYMEGDGPKTSINMSSYYLWCCWNFTQEFTL